MREFQYKFYAQPNDSVRRHVCSVCIVSHVFGVLIGKSTECQPSGPGQIPGMSHSETAITRGNLIKLLPPTKFSVSARCQVFSCLPKSKLNLQLCRLYICFGFYFPSVPVLITDWSSSLFRQEYTSVKYTKVRVLLQQFAMLYLYLISALMTIQV